MNKYLLFVLFISAPLFLVAQKADDMKEKGDKYFRKGNYEKAFVYYKKADSLGYITKGPGVEYEIELCSLYLNGEKEKIEQRRNYADSCFKAKNFSETYNTCYQLIDDEYPDDDKKYSWLFYLAENNMYFLEDYREADSLMKNYQFEKAGLKYQHLLMWKDVEKNKLMIDDLKSKLKFCEDDTTEKYVDEHLRIADSCRITGDKPCALENMVKIQDVRPKDERWETAVDRLKAEIEYDKEHALSMNKYYSITAFNEKDFEGSIKWSKKVLEVLPDDSASLKRVSLCEEYLADPSQSKKMRYDFLIAGGDKLFMEKRYTDAGNNYEKALKIIPGEKYPEDKIKEINIFIDKYKILIKEADSLFSKDSISLAKSKYEQSLMVMPHEQYPKNQVNICHAILNGYPEYMKYGQKLMATGEYESAIGYFQRALVIINNDKEALDLIAKCQQAISTRPPKQDKYSIILKKADELFFEKNWAMAKKLYEEATLIRPGEQYPKDQVAKCDVEINIPVFSAKYKELISEADKFFLEKKWKEAKLLYEEAMNIEPKQNHPKDQIAKCEEEIKKKTELNEKEYQEYMKVGDMYMKKGEHDKAIDAYIEALKRKPDDPAAKDGMETATYLKNRKN